jgi:hypothetical protein
MHLKKETDCVMNRVTGLRKIGIQWSMKESQEDLEHEDDICLLAQRFCDKEEKLKTLEEEAESAGLHINRNKTRDESQYI